MTSKDNFDHESYQDTETIKQYFLSLVEGFGKGHITLNTTNDQIVLPLSDLMKFKVRAKKNDEKSKIEISISWRESRPSKKNEPISIG